MVRHLSDHDVHRLARGDTGAEEEGRLRRHLDQCEHCGERYDAATSDETFEAELRAIQCAPLDEPGVGDSLGRYRILRRIGAGGMGFVYEAEQRNPRRRVALKVLRPIAATPSGLRRFEFEAEALSRLDHPAIAHVHEAGTCRTPHGELPFLAMELVEGVPPLEYARTHGLDRHARVRLFLRICRGVEHAHRRGVLHRDLKPSNILVDEGGRPKVLDFGLARPIERSLESRLTRSGQLLGTWAYISPEQLDHGAEAVDVRADVYALGIVLHELLVERLPDTPDDLPIAEWVRRRTRGSSARDEHGLSDLDPDLRAVLAKTTAVSPDHRYASVAHLAEDLERLCDGLPVEARPIGWFERAWRRARGHRRVLAAAFVLLAGGLAASLAAWRQASRASAAERRMWAEARASAAASDFLEELLSATDPFESGRPPARDVRELLDQARTRLATAGDAPVRTRARLRGIVGRAYINLGLFEPGWALLDERARELVAKFGAPSPDVVEAELDLAWAAFAANRHVGALERLGALAARIEPPLEARYHELRARISTRLARYAMAEREFALARATLDPTSPEAPIVGARLDRERARVVADRGRLPEAIALAERAVEGATRALGPDHPEAALAQYALAVLLAEGERPEEAERAFERAGRALEASLGPRNAHTPYLNSDWADLRAARGDADGAIELYRRALASLPADEDGAHVWRRARVCVRLALLLEREGEIDDLLTEALASMGPAVEGRFVTDHPMIRLAKALAEERRFDEVIALYERLLADVPEAERESEPTLTLHNNLAAAHAKAGDFERARELFERTLAVRRELLGSDHARTATAEANLAAVLLALDELEPAESLSRRAEAWFVEHLGPEHARVARTRRHLAEIALRSGRTDEALELSASALELTRAAFRDRPTPHVADTWMLHGECLARVGRKAEAVDALTRAREAFEAQPALDRRSLARIDESFERIAHSGDR